MTNSTPLNVVVVCGNPKPNSRTLGVARDVAVQAAVAAGRGDNVKTHVIDLSELGGQLFDCSSEAVAAEVAALSTADLAVIASPTFKATYTACSRRSSTGSDRPLLRASWPIR